MTWIHTRTVNCSLVLKSFLIKREKRILIFIDSAAPLSVHHQSTYLGISSLRKQGDSEYVWEALSHLLSSRVWYPWSAMYILIRGCLELVNRNGMQKGMSNLYPSSETCITATGTRPLPLWDLSVLKSGVLKLVVKGNPHLKKMWRLLLE